MGSFEYLSLFIMINFSPFLCDCAIYFTWYDDFVAIILIDLSYNYRQIDNTKTNFCVSSAT